MLASSARCPSGTQLCLWPVMHTNLPSSHRALVTGIKANHSVKYLLKD